MFKKIIPLLIIAGCTYGTEAYFPPVEDGGDLPVDPVPGDSSTPDDSSVPSQDSGSRDSSVLDGATEASELDGSDGQVADEDGEAGLVEPEDAGQDADTPDAEEPVDPPDPPYQFHRYDVNHILSTGQSNSVGNGASTVLSTTQPYRNVMFDTGVMTSSNCDGQVCRTYNVPNSFVPLVEGDRFFNYSVETMSSAMANQITAYYPQHVALVSLHGRSGNVYKCLAKNTCSWFPATSNQPFEEGIRQVQDGKRLAQQQGQSYAVRAITVVHGESDQNSIKDNAPLGVFPQPTSDGNWGTPGRINSYKEALFEWQRDYDTSIKAITGQPEDVPLFITQISGWNNYKSSLVAIDQYRAHVESNGKVVLVAPSYFLNFLNDCLHFSSQGMQRMGEYLAKAYYQQIILGQRFEPLRPRSLSFSGNQKIVINYIVPKPPMVFDTQTINNPGDYGFEVYENGVKVTLSSVTVNGNSVELVPSRALDTANVVVTYALNQTPNTCIGNPRGARGNLRDSDNTPSRLGYAPLYNWGVHFSEKVLQ